MGWYLDYLEGVSREQEEYRVKSKQKRKSKTKEKKMAKNKVKAEKLVDHINEGVELVLCTIYKEDKDYFDDTKPYDKNEVNDKFNKLKRRQKTYIVGRTVELLDLVRTFNLIINPNYYNFMRHLEDEFEGVKF